MYNPRLVVGDYFENKVRQIFGLLSLDLSGDGKIPDLISKNGSFYIEVKGSSYNNGGVIKEEQIKRFQREIDVRRFYAFAFHSVVGNMQEQFKEPEKLIRALDLKSLYLFPLSIVLAHFENSKKRVYKKMRFVQLNEDLAERIFNEETEAWKHLGLNRTKYEKTSPHEKIHIMTREGNLETEILSSFNPLYI